MPRAIVTGARGFIGGHLVRELRHRDFHVRTIRMRVKDPRSGPVFGFDGVSRGTNDLGELIAEAKPDVIFHLAGAAQGEPSELFAANVSFALHLIEGVRRDGLSATIVLVGSAAEYGRVDETLLPVSEETPCRPITAYGASKYAQTCIGLAAAATGASVVIARLFNVIGVGMPRHLPLGDIAYRLSASRNSGQISVGNLDLERDYSDVADIVQLLPSLANVPDAVGQVVNICTGHGTQMRRLVEGMIDLVPWRVQLIPKTPGAPKPLASMVGRPDKMVRMGLPARRPDFNALLSAIVADSCA